MVPNSHHDFLSSILSPEANLTICSFTTGAAGYGCFGSGKVGYSMGKKEHG